MSSEKSVKKIDKFDRQTSSVPQTKIHSICTEGEKARCSVKPCYRCLKHHDPKEFPLKNAECFSCKMTGHIKAACWLRKTSSPPKKNYKPVKIKTLQEQLLNYMEDINNDLSFIKPIAINEK